VNNFKKILVTIPTTFIFTITLQGQLDKFKDPEKYKKDHPSDFNSGVAVKMINLTTGTASILSLHLIPSMTDDDFLGFS